MVFDVEVLDVEYLVLDNIEDVALYLEDDVLDVEDEVEDKVEDDDVCPRRRGRLRPRPGHRGPRTWSWRSRILSSSSSSTSRIAVVVIDFVLNLVLGIDDVVLEVEDDVLNVFEAEVLDAEDVVVLEVEDLVFDLVLDTSMSSKPHL